MLRLLYLLVLTVPLSSWACDYTLSKKNRDLSIFEDYTECLMGLKDQHGKIVLKAEYESIQFIEFREKGQAFVLLKKNGLYGTLNCQLETVIPIEYSYLYADGRLGLWKASQSNQFGLLEMDGKVHTPLKYEDIGNIYAQGKDYIRIKTKEGFGVLEMDGTVLIPAQYESIENVNYNSKSDRSPYRSETYLPPSVHQDLYWRIRKNKKLGVLMGDGSEFIDPKYYHIEMSILPNSHAPNEFKRFWKAYYTADSMDLINSKGEVLVNGPYASIQLQALYCSRSLDNNPVLAIAELYHSGNKIITNLRTGDKVEQAFYYVQTGCGIILGRKSHSDTTYIIDSALKARPYHGTMDLWNGGYLNRKYASDQSNTMKELELSKVHVYHKPSEKDVISTVGVLQSDGEWLVPPHYSDIYLSSTSDDYRLWTWGGYWGYTPMGKTDVYGLGGKIASFNDELMGSVGAFFHSTSSTISNYITSTDTLLLFQGEHGLLAVNQLADTAFYLENVAYHNLQEENQQQTGIYCLKDNQVGIVDLKGQWIYEPIYEELILHYSGDINLTKQEGKMELSDQNGTVLFKDADTVFLSAQPKGNNQNLRELSSYQCLETPHYRHYPFALKNGTLWTITKKGFVRFDSTFISMSEQKERYRFSNFLVDNSGKLVYTASGTLRDVNHFFMDIVDTTAIVLGHDGTEFGIPSYKATQLSKDYIRIKLQNNHVGLLKRDGSGWLLPPEFYAIRTTGNDNKFWVKTSPVTYDYNKNGGLAHNWHLVDATGKQLTTIPLQYPVRLDRLEPIIFPSDSLVGLMTNQGKVLVDPEYIYIQQLGPLFLLHKKGRVQWYHPVSGISDFAYHRINYDYTHQFYTAYKRFQGHEELGIFTSDSAGIEWVIPIMDKDKIISQKDLATLLYADGKEQLAFSRKNLTEEVLASRIRLDNELIASNITHPNTHYNRGLSFYTYYYEFQNPYRKIGDAQGVYFNYIERSRRKKDGFVLRQPLVNNYQSQRHVYSGKTVYSKALFSTYQYRERNHFKAFENYVFHNGYYQKVSFKKLFVQDPKFETYFYETIEKTVNEKQLFGLACPDMSLVVQKCKEKFVFGEKQIVFYPNGYSGTKIYLPYKSVKKYVKKEWRKAIKKP